jgi:hypothetical protein
MRGWTPVGALAGTLVVVVATGAAAQAPKGKPATITGRVVDNICMLGMGLNEESRRECAMAATRQTCGWPCSIRRPTCFTHSWPISRS